MLGIESPDASKVPGSLWHGGPRSRRHHLSCQSRACTAPVYLLPLLLGLGYITLMESWLFVSSPTPQLPLQPSNMVYSTALFSVLLALIGTADAAPAPPAAADKRFNQPHLGHTYDVPIRTLSRRMDHSDPEVRAAYIRDEGISHRMIHAARLDAETNELRKRDEDFLHAERMMRKRQEPGAVQYVSCRRRTQC